MGFRSLRVINDDRIAPGQGFGTHSHRDMEIISYVLSGALEHKDSLGNGRVIRAGEFQYMAAGTGIRHSEFNPSNHESTHLLQIWILPNREGVPPRYAERVVQSAAPGQLHLIASPTGRSDSIAIHQEAELWLAKLNPGDRVEHSLSHGRHAWVQIATGAVNLSGHPLTAGDGAGFSSESVLQLSSTTPSAVLLFDLP